MADNKFDAEVAQFTSTISSWIKARDNTDYKWDIRVRAVDSGYAVEVYTWLKDRAEWKRVNFERQQFRANEDMARRLLEKNRSR